jgi:hypothetical protein
VARLASDPEEIEPEPWRCPIRHNGRPMLPRAAFTEVERFELSFPVPDNREARDRYLRRHEDIRKLRTFAAKVKDAKRHGISIAAMLAGATWRS